MIGCLGRDLLEWRCWVGVFWLKGSLLALSWYLWVVFLSYGSVSRKRVSLRTEGKHLYSITSLTTTLWMWRALTLGSFQSSWLQRHDKVHDENQILGGRSPSWIPAVSSRCRTPMTPRVAQSWCSESLRSFLVHTNTYIPPGKSNILRQTFLIIAENKEALYKLTIPIPMRESHRVRLLYCSYVIRGLQQGRCSHFNVK